MTVLMAGIEDKRCKVGDWKGDVFAVFTKLIQ